MSPTASETETLTAAVAQALRLWDTLELELGDLAVITGSDEAAQLAATVATWYGAHPVILIGPPGSSSATDGIERLAVADPGAATGALTARLKVRPGVAAAELTGQAAMSELLLEALPQFGRVFFGGLAREPLTIDFYVNVHRKGLRLHSGVFDLNAAADRSTTGDARLARARQLLSHAAHLDASRAALKLAPNPR